MKSVIIIPTLNPDKKIIRLVQDLKKEEFNMFVIVNDGSTKEYEKIFKQLESLGCKVTKHKINEGKGKAIKTGINFADKNFKDFIGYITVDGDYQHLPKDVKKVALKMEDDDTKIVLGERNLKGKNVPIKSRIGNGFSTLFFKIQTGVYVEDTQTGLRGIPCRYRDFAMQVEGSRYEYEMNFLREAALNKINFEMVKIETVYENNNEGTHFRPLKDAYLIYKEPINFTLIAIISSVIDVGLFTILYNIFSNIVFTMVNLNVISALSNVIARVSSGIFNFSMNKMVAFKSRGNAKKQLVKYILLFITQMCISTFLVSMASNLPINITVAKIIIDFTIFFVNYFVEKRFIFNATETSIKSKTKTL